MSPAGITHDRVMLICKKKPTWVRWIELQFGVPFRIWAGYPEPEDGSNPPCLGKAPFLAVYLTQIFQTTPDAMPIMVKGMLKEDVEQEEAWRNGSL